MSILITEAVGVETLLIAPFVAGLDRYYPGIKNWLVNRVASGDDGGVVLVARDGCRVAGVAMARRGAEPKLRCVRVLPELQGSGLGLRLIDRVLDAIECRRPACTVAEELLHDYSRPFLRRYGFALVAVERGMYRPGRLEYCFNQKGGDA